MDVHCHGQHAKQYWSKHNIKQVLNTGGGTSINSRYDIPDISGARNLGGSTKYWSSG